jgi:urease accessory protein
MASASTARNDSCRNVSLSDALKLVRKASAIAVVLLGGSVTLSAHHMTGGKVPVGAVQGFLSGLAHPVLGLDHLAVVLALGLLSVTIRRGKSIPFAFLLASIAGTAVHLMSIDLMASQLAAAASTVCLGAVLFTRRPNTPGLVIAIASFAGIFHGYAYAESIVGAESAPLVAYLLGFTMMQYGIAMVGRAIGHVVARWTEPRQRLWTRARGTTISFGGIVLVVLALTGRG